MTSISSSSTAKKTASNTEAVTADVNVAAEVTPIRFWDRLAVRLAFGMVSVALFSLVMTFAIQSVSIRMSGFRPIDLTPYLQELIDLAPQSEAAQVVQTFPGRLANSVLRTIAISLLLSGCLWVYLALRVAQMIARPVEHVTAASAKIMTGDLQARVDVPENIPGETLRLLARFNQMAQSLETYERERTEMIAAIAHELRTPLAVMKVRQELLEEGMIELNQSEISLLGRQIELLTRLVEDLRTLSLADANRLSLKLELVDLTALVARIITSFEHRARDVGIEIVSDLTPVQLEADPQRLEQVVINLLDNACKHTPEGGQITISLTHVNDYIQLTVHDTGPGFKVAPEQLFKRFYTSDALRASGTGLGLSLVDALVKLHGGQVSAHNHLQGGAVFEVCLPVSNAVA
jgi:signal transduction histidine kinase